MYAVILALHNLIRWIVVVLGLLASARCLYGWFGKTQWTETERKLGFYFTTSVDVQMLVGLVLYLVYSEWGLNAIISKGLSFVMSQSEYRFFAVEHAGFMLLGVVFAHLGSALPKKVTDSRKKYKRAAIWFTLAVIVILLSIPWSRPLFP